MKVFSVLPLTLALLLSLVQQGSAVHDPSNDAAASKPKRGDDASAAKIEGKEDEDTASAHLNLRAKTTQRRTPGLFEDNELTDCSDSDTVSVIVVLEDDLGSRRRLGGQGNGPEIDAANKGKAAKKAQGMGVTAKLTYGMALFGFSACVTPKQLQEIEANPQVKYVELDGTIQLDPMETGDTRRQLGESDTQEFLRPGRFLQSAGKCVSDGNKCHSKFPCCPGLECSSGDRCASGGGGGDGGSGGGGSPCTNSDEVPWGIARVGGAQDGTGLTA